jgi:hypothetical protein
MGNELTKQPGQGQPGQPQQGQPGQHGQPGQDDKWKSNQSQTGQTPQDISKKDPTRQSGSGEQNEQEKTAQDSKRRAS